MIWQTLMAAGDLKRLQEIASVLIRYGFGDVVQRIGLAGVLEQTGRVLRWQSAEELARLEPPARIRRVLEELGPTFVKLGQILATRVDLFPPEWVEEFSKLQDSAPVLPFERIREQLSEDLGTAPESVFAEFDTEPLAAASVAQVHRARLTDGTAVVVKIRRPGIRDVVEADLRLLNRLAGYMESEMADLRRYHPREVMRQFAVSLRRELDFAAECRNAERVATQFADHAEIVVPRIHWAWCGERLNVQDCVVGGIPGRDLAAVDAAGLDRKLLAQRGAAAVLKMMLEDGFFHADPHPGNLFYLPENRIAFIDFGMVGRLSEARRYQVARLLHGLVSHDTQKVVEVLADWSDAEADTDALRGEVEAFVDQYHGIPLKQLKIGVMLSDLAAILREHGLMLPPDLTLMFKAFITLEGMGRQLDPDFDMTGEARPFLVKVMAAHHAPEKLARGGWRTTLGLLELLADLPQDLRRLINTARRGKIQIQIDVTRLDHFGERLDRAASRLTIGIVTAALIIGSSIVMTVQGGPTLLGLPFLGLTGFSSAAIGALWLLLSIWRSGRR